MNLKFVLALKVVAAVLIGICVVILLSVNKITSSIVLIAIVIVIFLPIGKSKALKWARVAFVLVSFVLILWNISTTELPKEHIQTGCWFFDKVIHLFNGLLKNVFGIGPYQESKIFFDTIH